MERFQKNDKMSFGAKLAVGAGAVALGASNAMALSIDVASTTTDLGLAFVALLGVSVLVYGFRRINGVVK